MHLWITSAAVTLGLLGVSLIVFGAVLSWFRRNHEIWMSYLAGFLSVTMSILLFATGSALPLIVHRSPKLTIGTEPKAPGDYLPITSQSRDAIIGLALSERGVPDRWATEKIRKSSGTQRGFSQYFQSLGYIPTTIAMSSMFKPGNIIRYSEGKPALWALAKEAAPFLNVVSAPLTLPELSLREVSAAPAAEKDHLSNLLLCSEASDETASISSLQSAMSLNELLFVRAPDQLYVVQESITCNDFRLVIVAEPVKGRKKNKSAPFMFKSQSPVVLAYRVVPLLAPRESQ